MSGMTYKDSGVDIDAGNRAVRLMKSAVERTHGPRVLAGLGSFGGLFDGSFKEMTSPVLVASTDGVGTKIKVASAVGKYDSIGHDIVNHCTNDILVQGAEPLFFLDYVAANKIDPEMIAAVVTGAAEACGKHGCALLGGETAEMPGVYAPGEFDLVGTIVGVVDRPKLIDGSTIETGDLVLAVPSDGLHTNGFSLARRVLAGRDWTAPVEALGGKSLADALLVPHRAYLQEVRAVWKAGVTIRGLAHITGGGMIENPPRVLPKHLAFDFVDGSWPLPPLFKLIMETGNVAWMEMLRVFNCGVGMIFVVRAADVAATEAAFASVGTPSWRIGTVVERGDGEPVRFI